MLNPVSLKNRINESTLHLKGSEKKFHETKELLKSLKKEISNSKGAIAELEKLLMEFSY